MNSIREWNWGLIGSLLAGVVILIAVYQVVEASEGELRSEFRTEVRASEERIMAELRRIEAARHAELQRIEAARQADKAELKSEIAALSAKLDRFIESVDSRLDDVEREQARLDAVNDLLAQQIQR